MLGYAALSIQGLCLGKMEPEPYEGTSNNNKKEGDLQNMIKLPKLVINWKNLN